MPESATSLTLIFEAGKVTIWKIQNLVINLRQSSELDDNFVQNLDSIAVQVIDFE